MKKLYIIEDEWYPVNDFYEEEGYHRWTVEVSDEDFEFIKQAFEDFHKAQRMLDKK